MVRVHFLTLFDSPVTDGGSNYERMRWTWMLQRDGPPLGATTADGTFEIQHGDLVAIEEFFTGAGAFEGLRIVVDREETGDTVLMGVGIEMIDWPKDIMTWVRTQEGETLRSLYEEPLNLVLSQIGGGLSMRDLIEDEFADEFWDDAQTGKAFKKPKSEKVWNIPLSKCRVNVKLRA